MISVLGKACVYNDCKLMYKQNVCFDLGNIYSERYVNGTYKVVCIFFWCLNHSFVALLASVLL